ncbi:hypothetical protein Dda_1929 [Drechslerella dactyloides]|uniref:Uncharacterized protein n=1 Tax=Drechslerella dactyloides TaxID=74499 RepID=A0AAD6NL20_DREDA|nr:hypothetical protein Dda_1929 [Drechslerella dactyloides]
MPNKHYLSDDSESSHSFPQKRHVSAPSRYTPVQAPRTPLYSPITQAPSPISPSRDDLMNIDKPQAESLDDSFEATALLTPQETKRSTASPPAIFQSPKQPRPASLDGRLAELSRSTQFHAAGVSMMDLDVDMDMDSDDADEELQSLGADNSSPMATMTRYFNQTDSNCDVIALKATIEMLRKRRQQCLEDIDTLDRMKKQAVDNPSHFAERVIAASQGAQKTSLHQGKHHWRLEDNAWEVPAALQIPRVPNFEWVRKYGVPPIYQNRDLTFQMQAPQAMQQLPPLSANAQDMINPTRMTTRATNNSARSASTTKGQPLQIRTGLDMGNRQKKNNPLMTYSNPYMGEFNSPVRGGRMPPLGTPMVRPDRLTDGARKLLKPVGSKKAEKGSQESGTSIPRRSTRRKSEITNQDFSHPNTDINGLVLSGIDQGNRRVSLPARLSSVVQSPSHVSIPSIIPELDEDGPPPQKPSSPRPLVPGFATGLPTDHVLSPALSTPVQAPRKRPALPRLFPASAFQKSTTPADSPSKLPMKMTPPHPPGQSLL